MVPWPTPDTFMAKMLRHKALRPPDNILFQVGGSEGVEEFYAGVRETIGLIFLDNGADTTVLLEAEVKHGRGRLIEEGDGAMQCALQDLERFNLIKIYRRHLGEWTHKYRELGFKKPAEPLDLTWEILKNYQAIHRQCAALLAAKAFPYKLRIGDTDYDVEFEMPDFGAIEERNGRLAVRPPFVLGDHFAPLSSFGQFYGLDEGYVAVHDQTSYSVVGIAREAVNAPLQMILSNLSQRLNQALGVTGLNIAEVNVKARIIPGQKIIFVITDLANALNRISKISAE